MSRYPRAARTASIKCINCNAPVVETIESTYVCVECGERPIRREKSPGGDQSEEGQFAADGSGMTK